MKNSLDKLIVDGKPGRTVGLNGSQFLFFSGYNYLGINQDEEFLSLILEGVKKYGWVFPSSRISNTQLSIYQECEEFLSDYTGSEDTVLLPSGFIAGKLASSLYPSLINSPGSHPAILQNEAHNMSFNEWCSWLMQKVNNSKNALAIATDSLNIFSAEQYNFSFLKYIKTKLNVLIDDSHGIGLTGIKGKGISSVVPQNDQIPYTFCYSLSKAFGIAGGAVSCTEQEASILRSFPEYTASSPVSPSQIYAFLRGQNIYARQREQLLNNIQYFIALIKEIPGIAYSSNFPVFILPGFVDENIFYKNNILISSFAYPDPSGDKLKRIVLNALHTREDLDILANVVHSVYNENKELFKSYELGLKSKHAVK
ncbi:MAG: aminotransferase class I/II-fold pyridoxal phosphate-dependent enzyme [Sphingobacteriaceae bacterium]